MCSGSRRKVGDYPLGLCACGCDLNAQVVFATYYTVDMVDHYLSSKKDFAVFKIAEYVFSFYLKFYNFKQD